jgi:hypothetical protein
MQVARDRENSNVLVSLRRDGHVTIEIAHGGAYDSNTRPHWRSISQHIVTWTLYEADLFRRAGHHQTCHGGYLPRQAVAVASQRDENIRVLAVTSYLHPYYVGPARAQAEHHARTLSQALAKLARDIPGLRVALRPHPLEDRQRWQALLHGTTIELSDKASLEEDIATSRILVAGKTSSIIEAMLQPVAVLYHRGFQLDPSSLLGQLAPERVFRDGQGLVAIVSRLIDEWDLAPEARFRALCFGPAGIPRPIEPLLRSLLAPAQTEFLD